MNFLFTNVFRLLFVVVLLTACDSSEKNNSEFRSNVFVAPQDGKLNEKQLLDYIAIRQRINNQLKKREQQKLDQLMSDGGVSSRETLYFDEIEKSVAESAGMSYEEYSWIKDIVINTRTALWLERYYELNNKIVTLLDQTLIGYEKNKVPELNHPEQKKMELYVDEMKNELSSLQDKLSNDNLKDAFAHNRVIIEKYLDDLEALKDN